MKKTTTKRVLKPWVEHLLIGICITTFMLVASINDFSSLSGMLIVYGTLLSVLAACVKILDKFGSKELKKIF